MKRAKISYDQAKMLAPITRAYLNNDKSVQHLFRYESTVENVAKVIADREKKYPANRKKLVSVLREQYANISCSVRVASNIESLKDSNAYTVTTGHQLNLFTGPLYFIYKIISAISAAEELNQKYTEHHFVPVYWMATEDADFEEINHTFINNQKLVWNSKQSGMVGEFSTNDMDEVFQELHSVLGSNISYDEIKKLVSEAYLGHNNLADATRFLVNRLFEKDGLIIIDGNSPELKVLFSDIVKDELFNESSFKKVSKTIDSYPLGYSAQVSPREVNLFYAIKGVRERIIRKGAGFEVYNTDIKFTMPSILLEIENHPERFSPNVILRPVYQELILPNVMYIGGGAEIAYWLELKSTFEYHKVSFPLLQIRNSFLILDGNSVKKVLQCCLTLEEMFLPENEQIRKLLQGDNPFHEKLLAHKVEVDQKIKILISEIEEFDSSLITSLKSTKAGFLSELKKLDRKIMKSVKRKNEIKMNRLSAIRQVIYPRGSFQERRVNVIQMVRQYGMNFFDIIKSNTDPFTTEMSILYPEDMTLKRDSDKE